MAEDEITTIIESAAAGISDEGSDAGGEETVVAQPADDGTGTETETPAATEAPADEKPAAEVAEEAAIAALEAELLTEKPTLGSGRIKVSRHQAVLTNTRRKYESQIAERDARLDALKTYEAPEVAGRLRAAELAESDPARFVQVLQAVPEYKALFDKMIAEATAKAAPAAPAASAADEEPKPNVLLADGTLGYDEAGTKRLVEFRLAKAQKDFDAKIEALRGDIKPFQEERQTQAQLTAAVKRQSAVLSDARTNWPGFTEHEAAIRAELAKPGNESIGLEQAYRNVVVPKFRADGAKMESEIRAKVLKEMSEKAKASRAIRPGLPAATSDDDGGGEQDTESIIRQAMRSISA